MRKATLLAAVLVVAGLASLPGVAVAQQEELSIRGVDLEDFPEVGITVSVPNPEALDPEQIVVREDGRTITEVQVGSLTGAEQSVDIVLVIDTSGSMQGAPMQAAKAAATRFIRSVPNHIGIGIVTFADSASVALRISDDRKAALDVVGGLVASGETALYDGVGRAVALFAAEDQRNIVLLSDGGDTASASDLQAAVKAAKESEAAIYSVGLQSGEFDENALRSLSSASGGRYSPAATADLTALYEGLATELSEQFVVSYRSASEGGGEMTLTVSRPGGSDSVLVLAPRVEIAPPPAERPVEEADPLLKGTSGLIVVLILTFAATGAIGFMLVGTRGRQVRQRKLQRELAGRATAPQDDQAATWSLVELIPDPVMHAAEKMAQTNGRGQKLELKLERAGWPIKPSEFIALNAVATVTGFLFGVGMMKSILFGLFMGIAGTVAFRTLLEIKIRRRLSKLQDQLPDILAVLASSLRAGHSFLQALDTVAQEMEGAGGEEFSRVVTEVRLGRPVDQALNDMAERVDSDDFRWAILAVNIQRNVGGNLAEVLDTVVDTIRERETIRRQVKVLSAEGRMSIVILGSLPFLVGGYMAMVNREYISLLFTTRIGVFMVVASSALMGLGLLWMKRIVKIDV